MKYMIVTMIISFLCGSVVLRPELVSRLSQPLVAPKPQTSMGQDAVDASEPLIRVAAKKWYGSFVRAPGKIEGKTDIVEIKSRIAEQIKYIHVRKGQFVNQGDVLVSLDTESLIQERDLAQARLTLAVAQKARIENGARKSQIEAAKQEYEANLTPLWSAERTLDRGQKLFLEKALSQQSLDQMQADVNSLRAKTAAARARLQTLELPAREDDIAAADASIRAADARLQLARINLDRAQLRAPSAGQILQVNIEPGELTAPDVQTPMIAMVDTSQLFAVVEVDEFDALRVELGQVCEVTSDASDGVLATGRIVEIEPQMNPKRIFGQWASERNDTFSRKVRIALDGANELPIGLPVEVAIRVPDAKQTQ